MLVSRRNWNSLVTAFYLKGLGYSRAQLRVSRGAKAGAKRAVMAGEPPGESPGAAPSLPLAARADDGGATRASRAAAATRRRRPDHDPHAEGRLKSQADAGGPGDEPPAG